MRGQRSVVAGLATARIVVVVALALIVAGPVAAQTTAGNCPAACGPPDNQITCDEQVGSDTFVVAATCLRVCWFVLHWSPSVLWSLLAR